MSVYEIIGISAGIISFLAYGRYIYSVWLGKTKPSRATWWILTLVGTMIALSYYSVGARDTMWLAVSYVICPLIVAILSIKNGEGSSWNYTEKICLFLALVSILLWIVLMKIGFTNASFVVLIINIVADFIGILPTIIKSYYRPENEDISAWILSSIAGIFNLLAIENWNIEISLYPLYLATANPLIAILIYRGLRKIKN